MNEIREKVIAELVNQLRANVEGLEGLEAKDLPLNGTFEDMGASSLDMVEVVSTMMARLQVSVDRTAFARLENLDQLVQLFEKQLAQKA